MELPELDDASSLTLSPDGHWVAYEALSTGRAAIYVRPFPNLQDGRWQPTADEAYAPAWGHNGRELFYVGQDSVYAVDVSSGAQFAPGVTQALFAVDGIGLGSSSNLTVSRDDQRFLMHRTLPDETAGALVVVQKLPRGTQRGGYPTLP